MADREYIISTDTGADMPAQYYIDNKINVLDLSCILGESDYPFNSLEQWHDSKNFYDKLRKGIPAKTSQVPVERYREAFERMVSDGYDVLQICLSSGISGTYASAIAAAAEVSEKHPEAKVYVVDSLSASMGEGLLLNRAICRKNDGMSIDELVEFLEKDKHGIIHYFTVDDLMHLQRGGRVSKAAAIFGTALGVKPVLHVSPEGKLVPVVKVRGRKQSLVAMADKYDKMADKSSGEYVFISHCDSEEDAHFLGDLMTERFGVKVKYSSISPVVGAHSGPGTIAMFFVGPTRAEK